MKATKTTTTTTTRTTKTTKVRRARTTTQKLEDSSVARSTYPVPPTQAESSLSFSAIPAYVVSALGPWRTLAYLRVLPLYAWAVGR
jgi:hypothetical protein